MILVYNVDDWRKVKLKAMKSHQLGDSFSNWVSGDIDWTEHIVHHIFYYQDLLILLMFDLLEYINILSLVLKESVLNPRCAIL